MASTYNAIGLELMATGENAGTWGDKTNSNLQLLQQAIAGYEAVTITDSATTALVMTDATLSNARNMVIKFNTITLTGATTVTIPDSVEKFYIFDCTAITAPTNLTIKTASGTGFTIDAAKIYAAYSDGTDLKEVSLDTLGGTIGSAQIADNSIITAKISDNQITTAKISDAQITAAKISDGVITAAKIVDSTITQSKLATDSVGSDQLISTGVTAASYTTANITVDADGRITAASSGTAGFTLPEATFYGQGPASGTFTAQPGTTELHVFVTGGGGGGSGSPDGTSGTNGGFGGFGYFKVPISQPYSVPYTIGAPGAGGVNGDGSAGGNTTLNSTDAVATGGAGGRRTPGQPSPGPDGSAPGATQDYTPSHWNAGDGNGDQLWLIDHAKLFYSPTLNNSTLASNITHGTNSAVDTVIPANVEYDAMGSAPAAERFKLMSGRGGRGQPGPGQAQPGAQGQMIIFEV